MTARKSRPRRRRRNKSFLETHQEILDAAVRLISQKGVGALSTAAVARATGINRTTVYYHFASREALIRAVKLWSAEQISKAFSLDAPQQERIDYITRFVLENPELIKLWIEEFLSPGDIRQSYPFWDALVEGIAARSRRARRRGAVDAEVYCVMLLTSAIIGPRVFRNRVAPKIDTESIVERFRRERQRLLALDALLQD